MKTKSGIKGLFTITLFLYASLLFSQTFTEQTGIVLPGIANGNALWGDADNDGDIDILISGYDVSNTLIVRLYRNNGSFVYSDAGNIFSPALPSVSGQYTMSTQWTDIDNDGFLDIIVNTISSGDANNILIYRHEADHSYLLKTTLDFWAWQGNSFDCGDYDNDGDRDILVANHNGSRIYQNQGNFVFREQVTIQLEGVGESSCRFIDFDNDGDLDIFLRGFQGINYTGIGRLYKNNGNNTFSLVTSLSGLAFDGSSDWGDYNGDGYPDLLVNGKYDIAKIFKNNGNDTFSFQNLISLTGVSESMAKWGDIDNDGDLDIVLNGKNGSNNITRIFINNGNNSFTNLSGLTIEGVYKSSVDLFDYDNDRDLDILISGDNGSSRIVKVYKNNSTVNNPLPAAPSNLSVTTSGDQIILRWNSVRNDNTIYKSMTYNLMVGTSAGGVNVVSPNAASTGIYRAAGIGNAQHDTTFILRNLQRGVTFYWQVQAVDNSWKGSPFTSGPNFTYNVSLRAGSLAVPVKDAVSATLTWSRGNGANCAVFLKEAASGSATPVNGFTYAGNAVFKSGTQIGTSGWYCVYNGTASAVSVSNLKANTDYVFHVTEYTGSGASTNYDISTGIDNPLTFRTGTLTEIKTANLLPVSTPDYNSPTFAFWCDFDNDASNDLDILIVGAAYSRIYRNDGSNIFTLLPVSIENGQAAAIGDYDNDGLVDIAIGKYPEVLLYRNTGGGNFVLQPGALPVTGANGSLDWGDYDNDGDLDIVISGNSGTEGKFVKVFRNNGGGTFSEQQSIVLAGMAFGTVKWIDYDNDGYIDLNISGMTNDAFYNTRIYRNNGNNNFTEQTSISLSGTSNSSIDWGDYDNDGDADLLYTGDVIFSSLTKLYRNDGNNTFTEQTLVNLPRVNYGTARWGDYDSDGDLDILISGFTGVFSNPISRIYINEGNGSFTEDASAILPGTGSASAAWGDYDKDGDLDILLVGNTINSSFARIYRNELNIVNNAPVAPSGITSTVVKSDVTLRWKSIRTDNTPYKAITYNLKTGTTSGGINIMTPHSASNGSRRLATPGNAFQDTSFIFRKMTFGTYYWSVQGIDNGFAGSPFSAEGSFTVSPVQAGSLSARIVDNNSLLLKWDRGNGDRCAVFAKQTASGTASPVNNAGYVADPEIGFGSQIGSSGWYCVYNGRADSVLVTGLLASKLYSFHIFEYMGNFGSEQYFTQTADGNPGVFSTSLFTEQTGITLNSGLYNNVSWGDYDNDGFIDLLIPGMPSRIYRNNGNNTFTEKTGIALPSVTHGSAEWGDYDKDGDLDIIITGATVQYPASVPVTKIFRNDGSDVFTEQTSIILDQLLYSSAAWGDYDSDGDLDLVLSGATGNDPNYVPVSKIYRNNGNNSFTHQSQITLTPLYRGSNRWIDYDNDGDPDLVMTGSLDNGPYWEGVTKIYRNNGNGTFTDQMISGLNGAGYSSTAWGDYDNDGDQDMIFTKHGAMILYRNDRNNTFIPHLTVSLPYQGACYAAWGDYDNDGYLDIILSNPGLDTKIYRNTHGIQIPGAITQWFNKQDDDAVKSIGYSFVNWADYDNDGDLDFLISKESGLPTKIFRNNKVMKSGLFKVNTPPDLPAGLAYSNTPQGVALSWAPSKDNETPSGTLTYNLKIGTTGSNFNIMPSHSSASGFREIPAPGNMQLDTNAIMVNMAPGTYYWSVQAVDQSLRGSSWSPVITFEVKNVLAFFTADTVCQGLNTTFTNQSVGFGETITGYKWIFESGVISTQTNPSYSFSSAGVKNVTLIAFSANTSDTIVKQVLVKGKPLVDFSAATACLGTETTFTNLSDITGLTITSWSWDYGDGRGSTAMNPGTHGYLNAGNYEVILSSAANNGCSNSITKTVTVAAYPQASISATSPLSFCLGDSVRLAVASYTGHTYRWMSNGVNITGGSTNTITAKSTGSYTVEVINLTGNCTTLSTGATVTVLNAPAAPLITYSGSNIICQNDSLLLSVTSTPGYTYLWKLNGGAVGSNTSRHYAKSSGTYSVTVANSNGCSVSSSNQIPVSVNALPVVGNISQSGETKFCSGQSITLSVPLNTSYIYKWKKGNTETGSSSNSTTVSESGDYSVEVSTSFGCKITSSPLKIEVVDRPAKQAIDYGSFRIGECLGENPLKLSVKNISPDYTYTWYLNGSPVSNAAFIETRSEGKYVLEANYDICKSDTVSLNIVFPYTLPKPDIRAKGPTLWYLSTPAKATYYKWYHNGENIPDAENKNFYLAGQKLGIYRVSISDDKKCYTFSDTIRIPDALTGIEDTDPFEEVKIYPNPTSGLFTIEMNNNIFGELVIDIFSQTGSKVLNIKFEKTTGHFRSQIDLSEQPDGIYLINLSLDKFRAVRKVLVE